MLCLAESMGGLDSRMERVWGWLPLIFILSLALIPLSGNLRSCYEARLVGTASYELTVLDLSSDRNREIHTFADANTIGRINKWNAGDDLMVCNTVVTNRSKGQSAQCGDFGCLAIWP